MIGVAAGEAKNAREILPKAVNSMIGRIAFFYVGAVVLMTLVLPWTAYDKNQSPFVTFFTALGVPHAGDIVQIVVLTAAPVLAKCGPVRHWPHPAFYGPGR